MGLFSTAAVNARKTLAKRTNMHSDCYRLRRLLVNDGGGTDVETFEQDLIPFRGQIQTVFERAQDSSAANAPMDFSNLKFIYDKDVELAQEDRVLIDGHIYTIRNVYDNIGGGMTNQAYLSVIDHG